MKLKKIVQSALVAALVATAIPNLALAESVTYEEKDSGTNMGQSFIGSATVTYGQTPSFTVKIPKSITLDSEGAAQYTVGVKGQIPSKYEVNVVPDETILMEEENGLLDSITADVTAEKTTWIPSELSEDTYAESTNNTIQMQSIDYGKFEGTLNFNISAAIPIELKDASDEVKATNNFAGSYEMNDLTYNSSYGYVCFPNTIKVNDIFYLIGGSRTDNYHGTEYTNIIQSGYYKFKERSGSYITVLMSVDTGVLSNCVEYLGESYQV